MSTMSFTFYWGFTLCQAPWETFININTILIVKYFTILIVKSLAHEVGTVIIPILEMRKPRHQEMKLFPWNHTQLGKAEMGF